MAAPPAPLRAAAFASRDEVPDLERCSHPCGDPADNGRCRAAAQGGGGATCSAHAESASLAARGRSVAAQAAAQQQAAVHRVDGDGDGATVAAAARLRRRRRRLETHRAKPAKETHGPEVGICTAAADETTSPALLTDVCENGLKFRVSAALAARPGERSGFFNPKMRLNRDLSLAALAAAAALRIRDSGEATASALDACAASGAIGLRWAASWEQAASAALAAVNAKGDERPLPTTLRVHLNDADPACAALCLANAEVNGLATHATVTQRDCRALLCDHAPFNFVHLDPFGSVSPFLDAAMGSAPHGGVISLTATDTAALYGVYPKVSMRMYGARLSRAVPAFREAGARALAAAAAAAAARHGRGISILRCAAAEHFVAMVVGVRRGMRHADASIEAVQACAYSRRSDDFSWAGKATSADTNGDVVELGPLWSGPLFCRDWVRAEVAALRAAAPDGPGVKLLARLEREAEVAASPFYYDIHASARRVGLQEAPSVAAVLSALGGGAATHFERGRVRCEGGAAALDAAVRKLAAVTAESE